MANRIQNKVALITGAAQGIGEAVARLFAQEGATVVITDIDDEKGESLARQIGATARYLHLDVSRESEWISTMALIRKEFGHLDILVNNAGITGMGKEYGRQDPEHASLESWDHIHAVNVDSVFLGCKYAIGMMKERGNASIINMSSRSGNVGIPSLAAYASSKAAVRNHSKTVALYCAQQGYGIRCNSVHPAAIMTQIWEPMLGSTPEARADSLWALAKDIPLRRMGKPEDVAYAVLYLASDESAYVTGAEFVIDGGVLAGSGAAPRSVPQSK